MEFSSSAEVDRAASVNLLRIMDAVQPFLGAAMRGPPLGVSGIRIRYTPIIMGEEFRARYPARSEVRRKENLYDCSPQLDHEVFVAGSPEGQLAEYLRGLEECASALPKLGATPDQVEALLGLLCRARSELSLAVVKVHLN